MYNNESEWGNYDPYADKEGYNSSSPDLSFMKGDPGKASKLQDAKREFDYAKQDYDYMNQIGDHDEDVISRYKKATEDYKKALVDAEPDELEGYSIGDNKGSFIEKIFGRKEKSIPASTKEPIVCSNIESNKRQVNLDNFIQIMEAQV